MGGEGGRLDVEAGEKLPVPFAAVNPPPAVILPRRTRGRTESLLELPVSPERRRWWARCSPSSCPGPSRRECRGILPFVEGVAPVSAAFAGRTGRGATVAACGAPPLTANLLQVGGLLLCEFRLLHAAGDPASGLRHRDVFIVVSLGRRLGGLGFRGGAADETEEQTKGEGTG